MPIVSCRVSCTCTLELFVTASCVVNALWSMFYYAVTAQQLVCCKSLSSWRVCAGVLQVAVMLHCLVDSDKLLQVCREADRKQWHFLTWL